MRTCPHRTCEGHECLSASTVTRATHAANSHQLVKGSEPTAVFACTDQCADRQLQETLGDNWRKKQPIVPNDQDSIPTYTILKLAHVFGLMHAKRGKPEPKEERKGCDPKPMPPGNGGRCVGRLGCALHADKDADAGRLFNPRRTGRVQVLTAP